MIHKLSTPTRRRRHHGRVAAGGWLGRADGGVQQQPASRSTRTAQSLDVQTIEQTANAFRDITTLMVVHPPAFSDTAKYAIDQCDAGGPRHRIRRYVSESSISRVQAAASGEMDGADLAPLFAAWGVDYDPSKIVGDGELAQQVQVGGPGGPRVTGYIAWMRMTPASFNADDPVTGNLQQLNIATAGALKHREGSTTTFTPLLSSSTTAALIDSVQIRVTQNPQDLLRRFEPTGEQFTIAARVAGPAKTAYPNGPPPPTRPPPAAQSASALPPDADAGAGQRGTHTSSDRDGVHRSRRDRFGCRCRLCLASAS